MPRFARALRLQSAFLVLAAGLACTPSDVPDAWEALVFPAEARRGGTAAIVIDSNYIQPMGPERYDLHKDRVEIWLEDTVGELVEADVRGVFDLGAAAWSRFAQTRPGAWMTVALFDVPEDDDLSGPTTVTVRIDGVESPYRTAHIDVIGPGGSPTVIVFPDDEEAAEMLLESEPTLRLRAIRAENPGDPGFRDSWLIGGIEFDLEYFVCLQNARVFPDSNAAGATAILGPVGPGANWHNRQHVVLVDPAGFKLARPNALWAPTVAGEGPFVTLAFDRGTAVNCNSLGPVHFKIENLHVTDLDGNTLIDDPGDSTDLVSMIVVDTEAGS